MHGFLIFLCACPPECKNASSAGYLRICFQLVSFFQPVAYHHSHSVDSDKSEIAGLPVIYPYLLQGFITCPTASVVFISFILFSFRMPVIRIYGMPASIMIYTARRICSIDLLYLLYYLAVKNHNYFTTMTMRRLLS